MHIVNVFRRWIVDHFLEKLFKYLMQCARGAQTPPVPLVFPQLCRVVLPSVPPYC